MAGHVDDRGLEFQEFFASQYGRLCWLGFLLTRDRAKSEDLAQEALVRTFRMWPRVRRHDRPDDYARKVLVNLHRSLLRSALLEARHAWRTGAEEGYLPDHGEDRMVLWARRSTRSVARPGSSAGRGWSSPSPLRPTSWTAPDTGSADLTGTATSVPTPTKLS
jgi:DNA-directed RNA polymerase specialized sigma24 family protein